jgi:hypothetical protein
VAGRAGPQLLAAERRLVLVQRPQTELARPQHAAGVTPPVAGLRLGEPAERTHGSGGRATEGRRLGEPLGRQASSTVGTDATGEAGAEQEGMGQPGGACPPHPGHDPLRPAQERCRPLPRPVPRHEGEEVGLEPVDEPRLRAHQRRALVGCGHRPLPIAGSKGGLGDRHQEVGPLAGLQRARGERRLDHGEGVLGQATGQVGRRVVDDEVDAGHLHRVEAGRGGGVTLERLRQLAADRRQPACVVLADRHVGLVAKGGRDLAVLREGPGRRIDRTHPGVDDALEVERSRLPDLVPGAREQLPRATQVVRALLEAGQQVSQYVGPTHQHPPQRDAVECRGRLVEVAQALPHPADQAQRSAERGEGVGRSDPVTRAPSQAHGGPQPTQGRVRLSEVTPDDAHDLVADRGECRVGVGYEQAFGACAGGARITEQGAEQLLRLGPVHAPILADRRRKLSGITRRGLDGR